MIADFNTLSVEELKQFAVDLVAKVNAAKLFHDDAELAVAEDIDLSVDETFGSLNIPVYFKDGLDISMDATWTCSEPEDATSDYDDIEFTESESHTGFHQVIKSFRKFRHFQINIMLQFMTECKHRIYIECFSVNKKRSAVFIKETIVFFGNFRSIG